MIVGDPFCFAIQYDVVSEWNAQGDIWKNGLLSIYIDGKRIFGSVEPIELVTTISCYQKFPIDKMKINDLDIDAFSLYKSAREYLYGDAERIVDGLFDFSCTAMEDAGCCVYYMKTTAGDRLVWSVDNGVNVSEIMMKPGTIKNVIDEIDKCVL